MKRKVAVVRRGISVEYVRKTGEKSTAYRLLSVVPGSALASISRFSFEGV